jgi:hypothetical protein
MNEKDPSGRECNAVSVRTKRLGYRGSQDHGYTLQERQGTASMLTNQCLEKERMLSERAEESFLTDSNPTTL